MTDTTVDLPVTQTEDATIAVTIDADKTPKILVTADEGIESLKEQVDRARRDSDRRLAEKDRIIADAFKQAQEAQREVSVVKKDQVGTIIESLNKDKEAAKRDYRVAMESGDFDKAADAQDKISDANARIVQAERGKMALEEEVKTPLRQPVQPVTDPAEQMASTLSPRSASWVRSHPEFARDPRLTRQMVRAHEDAIDDGHEPDSDGYFSFINGKLGIDGGRQVGSDNVNRQSSGREASRAPVSAPVGRDVSQSPGQQRPGKINLQSHEVQAAYDTLGPLYPDKSKYELLQIYAKNREDLISEGRMQRAS